MRIIMIGVFVFMSFFVRFLVFSYHRFCRFFFVIVGREAAKPGFAKYAVDANLLRLESSILKHAGFRGATTVGVVGG